MPWTQPRSDAGGKFQSPNSTNGGYPPKIDGLFQGKSHLEMDDNRGHPGTLGKLHLRHNAEQPVTLSTTNHTTSGTAKVVPILSQRCQVYLCNFQGISAKSQCPTSNSASLASLASLVSLSNSSILSRSSFCCFCRFPRICNHTKPSAASAFKLLAHVTSNPNHFKILPFFIPRQEPNPMSPRLSFRARSLQKANKTGPSDRSARTYRMYVCMCIYCIYIYTYKIYTYKIYTYNIYIYIYIYICVCIHTS